MEIIETYEFYDKPVLFACRNAAGHIYVTVLADETEGFETWLYVAMSMDRFVHVRSGAIDLRSAFVLSEDGIVFRVRINSEHPQDAQVEPTPGQELDDSELPLAGEYLRLPTATLPKLETDIVTRASRTRRTFARLRLELEDMARTEVPSQVLSDVLGSFQETVYAFGQAIVGDATTRGSIPQNILSQTEFAVTAAGPGSFEIELGSTSLPDLFGESVAGNVLARLEQLFSIGSNTQALAQQLVELRVRASSKYLVLLQALSTRVSETHFEWASPATGRSGHASLTATTAKEAITVIEQTEIQAPTEFVIVGTLIGANIDKKNYELWAKDAQGRRRAYSGRIDDSALTSIEGATIKASYVATIRQISRIEPTTGEASDKYVLVALRPMDAQ
jgi:hypothetical protein